MRRFHFKTPSESGVIPKGGLVPRWRRYVSEANPHFLQKMYTPGEVFGC